MSESTVFRILKRERLIKPAEIVGFKAGKEYQRKTKRPNELWATDCAYLNVVDWGWYYLVAVMDDFSRFILAWELKTDMAAGSLIDVIQQAVDLTDMADVPVEDRTALLSDNGPGYLSRQFNDYLRLSGIRHIIASLYHPQTNGKIERYHRTIKGEINLTSYNMPGELNEAIESFIRYYKTTGAITKDLAMSHLMISTLAGISRLCRGERKPKAGHYRQEKTIIEPSGSRAMAAKVSTIFKE